MIGHGLKLAFCLFAVAWPPVSRRTTTNINFLSGNRWWWRRRRWHLAARCLDARAGEPVGPWAAGGRPTAPASGRPGGDDAAVKRMSRLSARRPDGEPVELDRERRRAARLLAWRPPLAWPAGERETSFGRRRVSLASLSSHANRPSAGRPI